MAAKDGERTDALDDLGYEIEDLYGVANYLERTRDKEASRRAALLATAVADFQRWLRARR